MKALEKKYIDRCKELKVEFACTDNVIDESAIIQLHYIPALSQFYW